jgi:hypothetical protein
MRQLAEAEDALAEFVEIFEKQGRHIPRRSSIQDVELGPSEMIVYITLRPLPRFTTHFLATPIG